jgi:hypothetical protein
VLVALLFTAVTACVARASDAQPIEARSVGQNPFHALLTASDVIVASPVVASGTVVVVREPSSTQGEIIRLDAEQRYRGRSEGRPIILDLSPFALRLPAGASIVTGLRYSGAERNPWTFVAGRDGLLIANGSRFERIRPDGTLEAVDGRDVQCSLGRLTCYARALASRGIVTAAQRASLNRSRLLDPGFALLYLIAFRSNRVRSFPVDRCAALRWTCGSSEVYRHLLHYGNVI